MKKLLAVSNGKNDFIDLLAPISECKCIRYKSGNRIEISGYDSFLILDSTVDPSFFLELKRTGRPVFVRTCPGIGADAGTEPASTRFKRLIVSGEALDIGLSTLLDDQDNAHLPSAPGTEAQSLLVYGDNIMSHSVYKGNPGESDTSDYALWIEGNVMFCSFSISNFASARFAPLDLWKKVMTFIINFLEVPGKADYTPGYSNCFLSGGKHDLTDAFHRALDWFDTAGIIKDEGQGGVCEGYATEIGPDGSQKKAAEIRNDCCGEVMFSYLLDYLLSGNERSKSVSDNISEFIFREMFTDEPGSLLDGMMKWSLSSPDICYQDDVARAVIPQMLKCLFTGTDRYMAECTRALEFLYKTTGTDGLRVTRTENQRLDENEMSRLSSEPAGYPSAHYTAYYHGALLLNAFMTGNERFMEMGEKGLESIMASYPDTKRCQSETQEMARLIMPLALLYKATGKDRHRGMLYQVADDLMEFKHASGTYLEWDTGYQSRYSRTTGDECSILTENGDPVSDLLYTVNWLPFGFIISYFVTKDDLFLTLWEDISNFMAKSQIKSNNKNISGAWARGWDAELKEVFALPNDVGWGPWCIESGWTVAEIASGIAMGLLKDKLIGFFRS